MLIWIILPNCGFSSRRGENPAISVVETPSEYTPKRAIESSKVMIVPKIPIEPVIVLGAAQISFAADAIQ